MAKPWSSFLYGGGASARAQGIGVTEKRGGTILYLHKKIFLLRNFNQNLNPCTAPIILLKIL